MNEAVFEPRADIDDEPEVDTVDVDVAEFTPERVEFFVALFIALSLCETVSVRSAVGDTETLVV